LLFCRGAGNAQQRIGIIGQRHLSWIGQAP